MRELWFETLVPLFSDSSLMSRNTSHDIVWLLILTVLALTGIRLLYQRIHTTRTGGEVNPYALLIQPPQAILHIHRPQLLQLMLPSLPDVEQLIQRHLPEMALCQTTGLGTLPAFTLIYYPQGEVWLATVTSHEAQALWNRLDQTHAYAAEEQREESVTVRYYAEQGKRFLGCYYHQGVFVATYDRKLLRATIRQQLYSTQHPGVPSLGIVGKLSTDAPLQLLLPRQLLVPDSLLQSFSPAGKALEPWLSLPLFFHEGTLCGWQEWPLPSEIPDSLVTTEWLNPLRDSLQQQIVPLLPGLTLDLQATHDEQNAYFTLCAQ